jgi:hypothetical protein
VRRALIALVAAVMLSLAVVPASHAVEGPDSGTGVLAQSSQQTNEPAGAPSIIPSPNERGENNIGGLIVGAVLLGGWGLLGFALYRQAQRRRATGATARL